MGRWIRVALTLGLGLFVLGAQAPADGRLLLRDLEGAVHDLDRLLAGGTPVVLVFWQTWCPSCRREAPALVHAVERQREGFAFFGVVSGPDDDIDDREVSRVAAQWGYAHPQIRDRDLALARRFEVTGTPVIVVLGTDAQVLYRGIRLPKDWSRFRPASRPKDAA